MVELQVLLLPCLFFGIAPFSAVVYPGLVFPIDRIVLSILVAVVAGFLLAASGGKGDD